jgi:hypothetical protein
LALLDQPVIPSQEPLSSAEIHSIQSTGNWADDAALRLVVLDAQRAENYATTKAWVVGWNTASLLEQSPISPAYWEGTAVPRSNVPFYTVATAVNSVTPQIVNGLFFDDPPFLVQPRPATGSDTARAIGDIISFQLDDINFRESIRMGVRNAALFGTAIFKWGWDRFTRERTIYKRKDSSVSLPSGVPGAPPVTLEAPEDEEIIEEVIKETVDRPFFDNVTNLRHVLVDSTLNIPQIEKGKFVIHRLYMTYTELIKLKDRPGYKIPSERELINLFIDPRELADQAPQDQALRNPMWDVRSDAQWNDATFDPFNEPLEILERWDNDKVIVVLQKKLVICNDKNPYGVIPFLSVNWWDVSESFYGLGLAKTIGSEQRLQQGLTNTYVDNATLNLQGVWTRVRGKSVPIENIRIAPGRIVNIENQGDFAPLPRTPAVPEAAQHIAMSQARAEQVGGVNEIATQGTAGSSGHSNLARTAAGANLLGSGSGNRVSDFIERLSSNVIIPFLYQLHELNRAMLPASIIRRILNDELDHAYLRKGGDVLELLNARVDFDILAGSKLAARRTMAQALPIMTQFLMNQFVQQQLQLEQKKISVEEVLHMFWESSDWKNYYDVVIPMTQQEIQRAQQNSPAALAQMKLQAGQQQNAQAFQQKQALLDQENYARAGRDVLRHAVETSASPEEIGGAAGGQGFGSAEGVPDQEEVQ